MTYKKQASVVTQMRYWLACSQTVYFLFKIRRARGIKYKPQGIYWPPALASIAGLAEVFEKNEKKDKITPVHRLDIE